MCTAGVREDGSWVRMYPVPFRRLEEEQQYKKFDWVECRLLRNTSDPRPETYRPLDENELQRVAHMDTRDDWRERRQLLLKTARLYDRMDELIAGAKANTLSLAVFKPTRIRGFTWEEEEREWDPEKLRQMRELHSQLDLFSDNSWRKTFEVIPKLPYSFSYQFEDANGKASELQVLDWEAGALYWKCLRREEGDERKALLTIRKKYLDAFGRKDLHFFLGTTQQWHGFAVNPWVIVGVFPIPSAVAAFYGIRLARANHGYRRRACGSSGRHSRRAMHGARPSRVERRSRGLRAPAQSQASAAAASTGASRSR